ncbi:MAG: tyrosine-protein phosphatase [Dysgonamonadaceae bacterium]|jgi:protein-tyrosine phosphatase|nr:tyrosine-protein phosphatase [Dysgonamonadaceae bacterium]
MLKRLTFPILSLLLFSYCSQEKPEIRVVCETTPTGNFLIKWETFPPINGLVKIYESSKPDSFNIAFPIAETEINKGFSSVLSVRTFGRSYFKLVFDDKYSVITAERVVPMQFLYNFRDLGGYYTLEDRQTRWGKLYRSSSLAQAGLYDLRKLDNLGVKTVIDFRTEKERFDEPSEYANGQLVNLPLRCKSQIFFLHKILSKEMRKGDVMIGLQDAMASLLEDNADYFIEMFNILLDENNYPVVMNCSMGKDRSGIASALILAALNIDRESIFNDFLLSNSLINYNLYDPFLRANSELYEQDPDVQETMTAMLRSHKETLSWAFETIAKKYGSIDNYLEQELKLTHKKREKLKEIMLY